MSKKRIFVLGVCSVVLLTGGITSVLAATKTVSRLLSAAEVDASVARPVAEREGAVAAIRTFSGDQNVTMKYLQTVPSSYNSKVLAEFYAVGLDMYEVDTRTNAIIQFGPRPLVEGESGVKEFATGAYTQAQLEAMARQKIATVANVDLSRLTMRKGSKGENTFFRWEDLTRELEGMPPFIQVGLSSGGDLVSYTNSLGL